MSQHIQQKLCRNSTTSKNFQRARFLYHSILLTAISEDTPSKGKNFNAQNIKRVVFVEAGTL